MYWDLLKVDLFRCHIRSNKCLVLWFNYRFVHPSWDVLRLGIFGVWWCMFVNKGGQGSVREESVSFLGWIIKEFRSKEICFQFLFINFMVFTKSFSRIGLRYGG